MENEQNVLEIRGLRSYFFTEKGTVPAVDGIDLDIPRGKIVGLVGESGCGKSMTAKSIMGLLRAPGRIAGGSVLFEGQDLARLSDRELRRICGRDISMVFQEPMTSLNPVLKVGRQVRETLLVHDRSLSKQEARRQVIEMFAKVGIPEPERRYDCYPHELSGGLRQRVMIAMAMVCRPKLLIADEPTTALDVTIEAQILRLMRQLRDETGMSVLIITHNLGGGGRALRPGVCDVCGADRGAGRDLRPLRPHRPPLHPGAAGLHPPHRGKPGPAAHHSRRGPQPAASAEGLRLLQPL